jgi:hypothetical protein
LPIEVPVARSSILGSWEFDENLILKSVWGQKCQPKKKLSVVFVSMGPVRRPSILDQTEAKVTEHEEHEQTLSFNFLFLFLLHCVRLWLLSNKRPNKKKKKKWYKKTIPNRVMPFSKGFVPVRGCAHSHLLHATNSSRGRTQKIKPTPKPARMENQTKH